MTSKENNIPALCGLVLAGGKSRRMGTDKGLIKWHGKEQQYYMADMLTNFCQEVFISCREEQSATKDPAYSYLTDSFLDMGPMGGILSALRSGRDKAWLVVACDLPLLNEKTLDFLVYNRDAESIATCFKNPDNGLPEPLIAIWEPGSYPLLLTSLARHMISPRMVLLNSDVTLLSVADVTALMNVNDPEEAEKAKAIMAHDSDFPHNGK